MLMKAKQNWQSDEVRKINSEISDLELIPQIKRYAHRTFGHNIITNHGDTVCQRLQTPILNIMFLVRHHVMNHWIKR